MLHAAEKLLHLSSLPLILVSRLFRVVHGVISSYVLLVAAAAYSLASIPVALLYLDTQRFGLWLIMGSLASYLSLIDAGVNSAAARLLIDHKDDRSGGNYGSLLKTGCVVSIAQGVIIFMIGLFFAESFAHLLAIPSKLQPEFVRLVYWQCGAIALTFSVRMLCLILNAHQRMDLSNYIGAFCLAVNFAAQWIFFYLGFGVISLALGSFTAILTGIVFQTVACRALNLFPLAGGWGKVSWRHFRELVDFGKDLFLVSLGAQLITTSQTIIITRMLGLEAAATWGIGLRVFALLNQVIWRISDMSASAFAEMLARREIGRLLDRYRSLAILTFSLAGWAAVSFAICNSLFVSIWTRHRIHWPATNDWLLAVWIVLSAVVHCHNSFVLLTKKVGFMRYIYFLEGILFVTLSFLFARSGGFAAIITCSIACTTFFSFAYGLLRISHFFKLSLREVVIDWMRPMVSISFLYLPFAVLTWWLFRSTNEFARLGINVLLAAFLGGYLFLRFGIPRHFQSEILARVPPRAAALLKFLFTKS